MVQGVCCRPIYRKPALAAWKIHGEEILKEYIAEYPGRRPVWFWKANPQYERRIIGESSSSTQFGKWRISREIEQDDQMIERLGLLQPGEQIPSIYKKDCRWQARRIAAHKKRLKEYPPEKFERSQYAYHA